MIEHSDVEWCKRMFNTMANEGVWAVPRSGMIFQRRGDKLVLINMMPWVNGMPISEAELLEQQSGEYEAIREHFEAAGVVVQLGQGISFS